MFQYLVLFIHSSNETKRRKHHQAAYGHGGVVGVGAFNKNLPHRYENNYLFIYISNDTTYLTA